MKYPDWLRYGNLGLAFLLELAALIAFALAGALAPEGWWQLLAGIAGAAAFVLLWGRWAAPKAKRRLNGTRLLGFKFVMFAVAVLIVLLLGQPVWAALLAVLASANLLLARQLHQR